MDTRRSTEPRMANTSFWWRVFSFRLSSAWNWIIANAIPTVVNTAVISPMANTAPLRSLRMRLGTIEARNTARIAKPTATRSAPETSTRIVRMSIPRSKKLNVRNGRSRQV